MNLQSRKQNPVPRHWNRIFWMGMSSFGLLYIALIMAMLVADLQFTSIGNLGDLLNDPQVRFSVGLTLLTSTIAAILSLWVAIPTGYVLARINHQSLERNFSERPLLKRFIRAVRYVVDTLLDIPIFLPPIVIGISLLILFQTEAGKWVDETVGRGFAAVGFPEIRGITYEFPAIILAQFTVAAAFAVRTMRDTFSQIDERPERIALTLGASHAMAFTQVAMPQAWRGVVAAFTLAWARSIGEFGPILVFAGTASMRTEVLSTTVYLNFQLGNLSGAVAASLILITFAMLVLLLTRWLTLDGNFDGRNDRKGIQ